MRFSLVFLGCILGICAGFAVPPMPGDGTGKRSASTANEEPDLLKWDCVQVTTKASDSDATGLVDAHNKLRAAEKGSDIAEMKWNANLANRAQQAADECKFEHILADDCNKQGLGQNIYLTTGDPAPSFYHMVKKWYDEKADYSYDSKSCAAGKVCGHYTQVVWAASRWVGCGFKRCDSVVVGGNTWKNAYVLFCNYYRAGNVQGQPIYHKGSVCSECTKVIPGGSKCDQGSLCKLCIPSKDSDCVCKDEALTKNGKVCSDQGTLNKDTCHCDCKKGYYGSFCENACDCQDAAAYASACATWAQSGFCTNEYAAFMKTNCPKTCNKCPEKPAAFCS